ncbi:xanthine-guanine phosphoribosyl transferase [Chlorella sorokiniana]|uniref:Xanthine-guanine phosphoribosyl transferase n=1 Tax=Chlorella sorokiniana TaxID=3076 RepID=A0A2P6U265_CHLSO|nr:xanthine-guanine phosphoribosyl transferase [Chlorella sorokiniana]|eukprot:PRW60399.1 xanthine-guanine phosphoribosyl transferase [Chlorella sorokiniana]
MGLLVEPATAAVQPDILLGVSGAVSPELEAAAAPKRTYFSWDAIHRTIVGALPKLQAAGFATPDYLIAVAGGGLIPARVLRSLMRSSSKQGGCAALKVIGLELYDDEMDGKPRESGVKRTQWLEAGSTQLAGKTLLIVDEVDDSRQTLAYAARELLADIAADEAALAAAGTPVSQPTRLGCFVIHNKAREKVAQLPEGVQQIVGQEVEGDAWVCYPWDAEDIDEHNELGRQ